MTVSSKQCDCEWPYPATVRLAAPGPDQYYLCPQCRKVRVQPASPGPDDKTSVLRADSYLLPAKVREQAEKIIGTPCPACGGSGEVLVPPRQASWFAWVAAFFGSNYTDPDEPSPCPRCGGAGRIKEANG
jgi:hypothetical protein